MPKGGSGKDGGTWTGEGGFDSGGDAKNMTLANRAIMREAASILQNTTSSYPELTPFANMTEFNQADLSPGLLGFYRYTLDGGSGNVVLSNALLNDRLPNSGQVVSNTLRGVTAHEIGHGLSSVQQPGFRSAEQTLGLATRRWNRLNPNNQLTSAGLAGQISNYARSSPHEAFAEAFTDWTLNGSNARAASRMIMEAWRIRR